MRLVTALCFVLLSHGCSADDEGPRVAHETPNPPPSERCRSNTDCLVGTTCQVAAVVAQPEVGLAAAALPACPNACFDPAQCPQGMTCALAQAFQYNCEQCVAGCKHQDCEAGSVCEVNTCQPVTPCTSADFLGCPQYWTCDPEAATQPPSSGVSDYDAQWRAHAAGCRPLLCSEPDARPCPQYTRCDDTIDSCVPIPCDELGMCPNNNGMVCREPRTNENTDAFGCVPATCEEGFTCQPGEVCDVSSTHPSSRGCRFQLCTEGYSCPSTFTCSPGTVGVDVHGCMPPLTVASTCQSDAQCSGQVCVLNQCRAQFGTCR
ncbi:MAG TPA: hypothetical protein VHO25_03640 [Polyangiaceae bacterium]|nr:hypothetical protein [Polyangiaceae bacterium]